MHVKFSDLCYKVHSEIACEIRNTSIPKLLLVSSSVIWLYWHNCCYFTPYCVVSAITCSFLSASGEHLSLIPHLFFFVLTQNFQEFFQSWHINVLSQWHVVKALTVAILSGINEKRDISMTAAGYCHGGYGVDWTIALPWYKSRIEATCGNIYRQK